VREHEGGGDDKRPNPAWLLLHNIEPFFREWEAKKEDRFFKVFHAIKEERLSWLASQISFHNRDIIEHQKRMEAARSELLLVRSAQANLRSLNREKYQEASANWGRILDSVGEIGIDRNSSGRPTAVTLNMPQFVLEDVELGDYKISLELSSLEIDVENIGNTKSYDGYPHPHVSSDGEICWGDAPRRVFDVLNRANPFEILFCVADFLKTSYTPGGAYRRLEDWHGDGEEDSWFCDFCEARHPDDDSCPQYCGECENNVENWDEHHTCFEHYRCWDERSLTAEHRSEDPNECPECRRERIAEEAEEEEEEESDEAESSADAPVPPAGFDEFCACADCRSYREQMEARAS